MAQVKLAADPVLVLDRFSDEVQLACPLFQRRYVWGAKNIDQLFLDIDTVLDEQYPKRFMGALVFNNEADTTAQRQGRYWIIDGQQRLTTTYLILLAIAHKASELGTEGLDLAQDTFNSYLVSKRSQSKGQPRIRPTLVDTKQFESLVAAAAKTAAVTTTAQPSIAPGDAEGDMTKAYATIQRGVNSRIVNGEDQTAQLALLQQLRDVVLECLEFVEIRLGGEHDPNEVFDRLNKEGEKLGILDLVRNEVLKHLDSEPQQAQIVYSSDWLPFEQAFRSEGDKAKYFFPFALTLDSTATQATTFKTLTEHLNADQSATEHARVAHMVRSLRRHQAAYNAIHAGDFSSLNEPVREQVRRLVALNRPSSIYPYVMQLLTSTTEGQTSLNDAAASLSVIESFLVRRAFRGIEPTGLHAVFKKLWSNAGADPQAVRAHLVTNTVVFPTDDEFEVAVRTGDLYHRRIARFVLEEYERAHSTGDVLNHFESLTIDHVAPQSLAGEWINLFPSEEHAKLLHTWANLVPLTSIGNSTKGTLGWEAAKQKLQLETIFSTTKHLYDTHDTWTPREVISRSNELAAWALERWPDCY